jgi:hypothetical protein
MASECNPAVQEFFIMKTGVKFFGALLLSFLLFTVPVGADPIPLGEITATHVGSASGSVNINWYVPGTSGVAAAGLFHMRLDVDNFGQSLLPEPGGVGSSFYAFCIELEQTLASPRTYEVHELADGRNPNPIGVDRANLVGAVLGAANFTNFGGGLPTVTGFSSAQVAAAIQVAIWEVVYESLATDPFATAFNVTSGAARFSGSNAVLGLAQGYLNAIPNVTVPATNLLALNSTTGSQNLLVQLATPGGEQPIPEPGTLALLGLGLIALGFMRRARAA